MYRQYDASTIYFILSFTLMVIILLLSNNLNEDINFAILYTILYIVVLLCLWKAANNTLTPLILFYLSVGIFIGGRFIAILLGSENELFHPTFFKDYSVSIERKRDIFKYIIIFIGSICIGGFIGLKKRYSKIIDIKIKTNEIKFINEILNYGFYIFVTYIIYSCLQTMSEALNHGYLYLYVANQNGNYSGSNIIKIILFIFFGLSFGYGNNNNKIKYLAIFILEAALQMIVGARGGFGIMVLIILWFISFKHHVSLYKILIIGIIGIISLIIIYSFSIRQKDATFSFNGMNLLSNFFYSQGIQLMCFDGVRLVSDFPILPYIQSLFPGVTLFYSILSGELIPYYCADFSNYLSYTLNPEAYFNGMGLGWSTISDIYLYSNGNTILFFIIGSLVSYTIAAIGICSKKSKVLKYILFTIIYPLIRWPRAGINDIMPLVWYAIILLTIILIIYNLISYIKNDNNSTHSFTT